MQTRLRASRLRATIKTKELDTDLGKLYDDCLRLLDGYESYLGNLGAIDRTATRRAQEDSAKVAETAFKLSFETAEDARRRGATKSDAVGGGILVGIIGGALEDYQRKQARDEATRMALEAESAQAQYGLDRHQVQRRGDCGEADQTPRLEGRRGGLRRLHQPEDGRLSEVPTSRPVLERWPTL